MYEFSLPSFLFGVIIVLLAELIIWSLCKWYPVYSEIWDWVWPENK